MEGKIAIEEHFSTELNNKYRNAQGESGRNGLAYTKDIESRLLDPELCLRDMDRAGIEVCTLSLTVRHDPDDLHFKRNSECSALLRIESAGAA